MDPRIAYWTWAWLNMVLLVGFTLVGVRQARRGAYQRHRRLMLTASWLVATFVGSYALKLLAIGREPLELWALKFVYVLRIHECFVAVMVIAGGIAIYLALKLGLPLASLQDAEDPERARRLLKLHRTAGRTAVISAALGTLTAGYVLLGMYQRLGSS